MYRFEHIELFWLLILIPVLIGVHYGVSARRNYLIRRIGKRDSIIKLLPHRRSSERRTQLLLFMLGLILFILALANLQRSEKSEKLTRKGIDVVIALDVSKSMLASDLTPTRLERAKMMISRMLEKIGNNRVGLVLFAGNAYVSVPLTTDMTSIKMNLANALPENLPTQGTVLSEALKMSIRCFNPKDLKYKSIVLISDGEDHDNEAMDQVKKAVGEGIQVHTIGIGSTNGAPIFDSETQSNKLDNDGQEIISKLNERELMDIADEANGSYHLLTLPEKTADRIAEVINHSEQRIFEANYFSDYKSYFQFFLFGGLILIGFDFFYNHKR